MKKRRKRTRKRSWKEEQERMGCRNHHPHQNRNSN